MEIKGTKQVVIGGAGFVGSHIAEQLIKEDAREIIIFDNFVRGVEGNVEAVARDPRVKVVRGDIRDRAALTEILNGADGVFLLAALWLQQCFDDPAACMDVNVNGTFNVVELCRDLKVKKIVYSSSASVYGDAVEMPMTEEHPFNNRTMYGASKIFGEQLLRTFYEMYKLDYVGLRYMNIYGPRQDYRGVYVTVIMKVLDRIDQGLQPQVYGDGTQSYDFVFVDDVARANILSMKCDLSDEFLNVGTGIATSIRELVEMLLEITGSKLEVEYKPGGQTFVQHRVGSTEKCAKLLGLKPSVPLSEGLRKLVDWRAEQLKKEKGRQ